MGVPILPRMSFAGPLYIQIQEFIRQGISKGHFREGDRLPSEQELAARFDTTRATVAKALQQLVFERVIARRSGSGTFVGSPHIEDHVDTTQLESFEDHVLAAGETLQYRLEAFEQATADALVADRLGTEAGAAVFRMDRLRLVNGRVVAPNGDEVIGFSATTTISRKDYGLTWNVALDAGGVLVADEVVVQLEIEAINQVQPRTAEYDPALGINKNVIRMLASTKTRQRATNFLRGIIGKFSAPYLRWAAKNDPNPYRVTLLAFLVKACVAALKKFPEFNSSLSPEKDALILKHYYNIGIAVDTPGGLVVPVVRDADRKGIVELSREFMAISAKARDGKLGPNDMQGGTFTISSLGGIGGTSFTPIVNAPEVAILGVVRSAMKPVWNGTEFVPRMMLPVSVSYDHRVIDGALAARFTRHLCYLLEDDRRLLL